jgi:hypothetical protein
MGVMMLLLSEAKKDFKEFKEIEEWRLWKIDLMKI